MARHKAYKMLLAFILSLVSAALGSGTVSTAIQGLGICRGIKETLLGKSVDVYKGIPYAKPPVGKLRFKPPEPITWSGVFNATKFGGICPQKPDFPLPPNIVGVEDCLYLDIYKPSTVSGKLPVMFWIHGGGYVSGSGHEFYDGRVLAAEYDVVVVTINHRLGVLGFFNIPGTETKGNYGILDQIAALRWVKKNIASFGGDPDKVTIFGLSSGAGSVSLLTLSPLTRNENLFKRAISQSGVASCPWAVRKPKTDKQAKKFGGSLGCADVKKMTECLRSKTVAEIMAAQLKINDLVSYLTAPNVDGHLLKDLPWDLERNNTLQVAAVEQMIGYDADEGTMFGALYKGSYFALPPSMVSKTYVQYAIKLETAERYPGQQDLFHQVALHEYTKYSSNSSLKWYESSSNFRSDFYFLSCINSFSDALVNTGKTVYRYKFTYMPKIPRYPFWKVAHAMENAFVFGFPFTGQEARLTANYTDEDKVVSRKVMKSWTDFAKHGKPGSNWPKYTASNKEYMNIGFNLTVERGYETRRMAFWNQIVPKLTKTAAPCKQDLSSAPCLRSQESLMLLSMAFALFLLFLR